MKNIAEPRKKMNFFTKTVTTAALLAATTGPVVGVGLAPTAAAATQYTSTTVDGHVNVQVTPQQEAQLRASIIASAASQVGVPYVWGGRTPGVGFDCSGLTSWSYGQQGINIPRVSGDQWRGTKTVSAANVKPGDLIFSNIGANGVPGHVGIVVDPVKKTMYHAPNTGQVVKLASYAGSYYNNAVFGTVISTTSSTNVSTVKTSTTAATTTTPAMSTTGAVTVAVTTTTGNVAISAVKYAAPIKSYATTTRFVKTGVVLNLRNDSSANNVSAGTVSGGVMLTGTPLSNGWFKITSGALTGKYVSNAYLTSPKVKSGATLTIRSAPSNTATNVGTVSGGSLLEGVAQNGWLHITSGTFNNRYVPLTYLGA